MAKVKEHYMQTQEKEFELEWSYQEWLFENVCEPSESELDEMEEDCCKSSADKSRIITHESLNNINFNPLHTTGA